VAPEHTNENDENDIIFAKKGILTPFMILVMKQGYKNDITIAKYGGDRCLLILLVADCGLVRSTIMGSDLRHVRGTVLKPSVRVLNEHNTQ
jgi:hypothetical protein